MMRARAIAIPIAAATAGLLTPAQAQDEAAERSAFIRFVEERISAPNMQIRLIGIEGTLSSDVSFERITVSDEDGVWLSIEEPRLVWNRSALLRGRVDIEQLSAEALTFTRPPLPDDSLPAPEARAFSIPELPVAVSIDELALPRAEFGEAVFGLQSVLSVDGSLMLDGGELAADLDIERLDGPGGTLALDAQYEDETLTLDARLNEPADGVLANLLNLDGRPPVSLAIEGGGPVDALDIDLGLDVGGTRILDGSLRTDRGLLANGTRLDFALAGPLADILPDDLRAFFGERTELAGQLTLRDDGTTIIDEFTLDGGAVSADLTGRLLADGFPAVLDLDAEIVGDNRAPIDLPGTQTRIGSARIALDYGGRDWTLDANIEALRSQGVTIDTLRLEGGGQLTALQQPDDRRVTFALDGAARGIAADDAGLDRALGDTVSFNASGAWQAQSPLTVEALRLAGAFGTTQGAGAIEGAAFDGTLAYRSADLAPLSGLFGRALSGAARLTLDGAVQPLGGAFDLDIAGALTDFGAGEDLVGRMLAGDLRLEGGVARTTEGLAFDSLEGENAQFSFALDGSLSSVAADVNAAFSLADLGVIADASSGMAGAQIAIARPEPPQEAEADPAPQPYRIDAMVVMPDGALAGQAVSGLRLEFDGQALDGAIDGALSGDGRIGGEPFALSAEIARDGEGALTLDDLALRAGAARVTGDLRLGEDSLATGTLNVDADNIAGLAALALVDASGALDADIALSAADGTQDAEVSADADAIAIGDTRIGTARIEADLTDIFGTVGGSARIEAGAVSVAGTDIRTLEATLRPGAAADLAFDGRARLEGGIDIAADGTVSLTGARRRIALDRLDLDTPYGDASLAAPARIVLAGDQTRIEALALDGEGGRVAASGTIAETIAVDVTLSALPVSIANAVRPELGLAGTVSGDASITGTPADPQVRFELSGSGLTAEPVRAAGLAPLNAQASGTFSGATIRIAALNATNPQGLDLSASGAIPIAGAGLALDVSGTAPLALGNAALAGRGTRLSGTLRVQANVSGSLADPAISGLASVSGGTVVDPLANIELNAVNVMAGLEGDRIVIRSASARFSRGGGLTVSGTIGLGPELPADLAVGLSGARYTDGQFFSADVSADLTITGPLAGGALIAGTVDVAGAEIAVPEAFGGDADLLDVRHVGEGRPTRLTLQRLAAVMPRQAGAGARALYRLDLTINAPNQIFVRGRGLDAELGGRVSVTGPLDDVRPVGGFSLIRGRLSVLNQRLDFTRGSVTLTGDLDPFIDLVAETQAGDLTAIVTLRGPVSDLDLQLSSNPALPEDEILARVLFGADIASLSPTQIARLAAAAASLAGGDSNLAGGLRGALGVDDLDIIEQDDGGVGVRAGRYLSDNVYLELETEPGGVETTINLDITDSLTARGSVDAEGDSRLGVFFERDY
ncbi:MULTISPECIES: translocation/assembly module TamB domain-containing protein [unclassified Roseitalea]|uniref:translocation/assembly module TamB domain-containing protein n=1 Tax=unclassified Roseitalea TaxID=2639107 RepID=UPI00273DE57F|nr:MULTISPECIES: translocation/assembly module TamB domain-containing protein [unclassified Roseitalea]